MKQSIYIELVLALVKLPFELLMLIVTCLLYVLWYLNFQLIRCRCALTPISEAAEEPFDPENGTEAANQAYIDYFKDFLDNASDYQIDLFRKAMERTKKGQKQIEDMRRVYAVAKPTRQENAFRIKNVFECFSDKELVKYVHKTLCCRSKK